MVKTTMIIIDVQREFCAGGKTSRATEHPPYHYRWAL